MLHRRERVLAAFTIAAALAALGIALGAQRFGGLIPCALCLVERWPWRIVLALGITAALLPRPLARTTLWLAVLTLLAGTAIGAVHIGVEQHWWPSPLPQCSAPDLRGLSITERLKRMPAHPSRACEDPDYPIAGLPITFAQAQAGAALATAAILAISLATIRARRFR
jgi:disulfide bond formation protein DsbB